MSRATEAPLTMPANSSARPTPAVPSDADMDAYFAGQQIYGDDFDAAQLAAWFASEASGYAGLVADSGQAYRYGYHALNARHGFDHLPQGWRAHHALAFGSAYGDELKPHLQRLDRITLLDASSQFQVPHLLDKPVSCLLAQASGDIAAADQSFDLITCFGALHHVANPGWVLRELYRVAAPGAHALLREPITSMGDWRRPRAGLTQRERGFPPALLNQAIESAGWRIERAAPCQFSPLTKLAHHLGASVFDRPWATALDTTLARAFMWNWRYHRRSLWSRFAPGSLFYVLRKA